jgi:cysteinyl-tRNA synthetase
MSSSPQVIVQSLQFHNTLTRAKGAFVPLDPARVRMYVCGPTVYDYAHIGNARPVVVFDVLFRVLRRVYGDAHVTYVRNITDIDDKIIQRHLESGEAIADITRRTADAYVADMRALGALDPSVQPRATGHIPEMIAVIERLLAGGHAYVAEGHVLFHVPSDSGYGKLSGRSRDEQIAGARVDVAPYKRDAADFVLWKPSTERQPGWPSPWGRGRPGWHIECSAMSAAHLGPHFDIHAGGHDLIFPHHENEIAQSECAHGGTMAHTWMHNGFLVVNGEKMSKSLGNFFTVRDLLAKWPGEAIRLLLLKTHYRAPLDFTEDGLRQARENLDRWQRAIQRASVGMDEPAFEAAVAAASTGDLLATLADDLNTPGAVAHLNILATTVFDELARGDDARARAFAVELCAAGRFLGFLSRSAAEWFAGGIGGNGPDAAEIDDLVAARLAARKARDFAAADRIRDDLKSRGVILEDGPGGTTWRRA